MRENSLAAQTVPQIPLGVAYSASSEPLSGGASPFPRTPSTLGPLGLQLWPFGPRSLPPQIRLPKSTYVVN